MLRRLSDYHQIPITSIHAPCLLLTQRVWGREPWGKLVRSQRRRREARRQGRRRPPAVPLAAGVRPRGSRRGSPRMQEETDVVFAVENMFPLVRARTGSRSACTPRHWNPYRPAYLNVTVDLSHAAVSRLRTPSRWRTPSATGSRTSTSRTASACVNRDEHLVPGRGNQPCAEMLESLAAQLHTGSGRASRSTRAAPSTRDQARRRPRRVAGVRPPALGRGRPRRLLAGELRGRGLAVVTAAAAPSPVRAASECTRRTEVRG